MCFATCLGSASLFIALLCSEAFPLILVAQATTLIDTNTASVWILYGSLRALSGSVVLSAMIPEVFPLHSLLLQHGRQPLGRTWKWLVTTTLSFRKRK